MEAGDNKECRCQLYSSYIFVPMFLFKIIIRQPEKPVFQDISQFHLVVSLTKKNRLKEKAYMPILHNIITKMCI